MEVYTLFAVTATMLRTITSSKFLEHFLYSFLITEDEKNYVPNFFSIHVQLCKVHRRKRHFDDAVLSC